MILACFFPELADRAVFLFAVGGEPVPVALEVDPHGPHPPLTAYRLSFRVILPGASVAPAPFLLKVDIVGPDPAGPLGKQPGYEGTLLFTVDTCKVTSFHLTRIRCFAPGQIRQTRTEAGVAKWEPVFEAASAVSQVASRLGGA